MGFFRVWLLGIFHPKKAYDELESKPAPSWGLWAVLGRVIGSLLIGIALLFLLPSRRPFEKPYFTFLTEETYYASQLVISPLFGIGIWLLMCSIVHLALRMSGKTSNFDKILNVIGFGMLVPMPIAWIFDQTMIAVGAYQMIVMAMSHTIFQVWETLVESIGLSKLLGIRYSHSLGLAALANAVFILGAMLFIR